MSKLFLLLLLFITGCAACPTCPKVNCPTCQCPTPVIEPSDDSLYVYFIDVGQGDAQLIKNKDSEMLIDCGRNAVGMEVVDFLKDKKVNELEYLLMTHPDSDHIGGCDDVLRNFKVNTLLYNGEQKDTTTFNEVMNLINNTQKIIVKEGDDFFLNKAKMHIIQSNNEFEDSNQNSVVSKLTFDNISFLFTGDCDNKCEELLLNKDINSTILKTSHHGSKFATRLNFLESVSSYIAVISVGENSYGHPTDEVLDRLSQEEYDKNKDFLE